LELTGQRPDEDDGEIGGRCHGYRGHLQLGQQDRNGGDRLFTPERRVHVETAEIFTNGLQLGRNTRHVDRNVVEPSLTDPVEAGLDVLHELPTDGLQRVDAQGGLVGIFRVIAVREHREQNIVLGGDSEILRQIWTRLPHVCSVHDVELGTLTDTVHGDLRVGVVVRVVLTYPHQFGDEFFGSVVGTALVLRGQEVREPFRAEP
ncbi:AAEL002344-PA, partial [Aedes aegypti]